MPSPRRRSIDELREIVASSPTATARQNALAEMVTQMMATRKSVAVTLPSKDRLRFGVFGDTHIGSTYERLDALRDYYANAQAREITTMIHAGDVLAGHRVYRGQEFEIHKHGWEEQRRHFAEAMPQSGDITTYFITGNHDASFKKLTGMEPGPSLMEAREDWQWVGADIGTVELKTSNGLKFRVQLLHPGGGTAYAISYRPQKLIESLAGGTKPDLLVIGHYHKLEFMPAYRNVAVLQAGCFEDQTPYMAREGIQAHVGGWFIDVDFLGHDHGSMQIKAEALVYY